MRVLLVEDDSVCARGVTLMLQPEGMVVDTCNSGEEGLDFAKLYDYDIVLLDLMLPDMEGYDVVRRLRAARRAVPVLILSGLARPEARVKAFGLGADDFLTKPFDRDELVARVRAIVRRAKGFSQPTLRVGPLTMNLTTQDVMVGDCNVALTSKEYAILELMTLRKGMVMTKDVFLNHLYGGIDEPDPKIIDVYICKLRKKLAAAGADSLIGTVWGRGYMVREPAAAPLHDPAPKVAAAAAAA